MIIPDQAHAKTNRRFTVAGLFAGVGGFELGLERAGHRTVLLCESDADARHVLRSRFKGVPIRKDIRNLHFLPRDVDVVTAGFPCQNLSQAGTTDGLAGAHSRLVWEVFRLIRHREPPFVVFENVPFMLRLDRGSAIAKIVIRLESLGYKWAYRVIDAQAFGLPQRRRRVFILATRGDDPRDILLADNALRVQAARREGVYGFYWTEGNTGIGLAVNAIPALKNGSAFAIPSAPAISLPNGRVVTPHICDAERLQGFPAHWTSLGRNGEGAKQRWRLVGNAVNVRVSRWIGCRLATPRKYSTTGDGKLATEVWPTAAYNVGRGRFKANVSEFPVERTQLRLSNFLRFEPRPLSIRATEGVLCRLLDSSLTAKSLLAHRLWYHLSTCE